MTQDTGWPIAPLTHEDLPPGIYVVAYRGCERKPYYQQSKIRLEFEIVEPAALAGERVSLYATCPANRNTRCSRAAKYYQLWVKAHGRPPQRGQRMSPSVFRGYWQVRIEWGKDKETGGPSTPCIADLIERVAGGGAKAC